MRTRTAEPCTVGEILREEFLNPLGITERQLTESLGCSAEEVTLLVDGKRALTHQEAERLSQLLRTSTDFWMNIQSAHDRWKEKISYGTDEENNALS